MTKNAIFKTPFACIVLGAITFIFWELGFNFAQLDQMKKNINNLLVSVKPNNKYTKKIIPPDKNDQMRHENASSIPPVKVKTNKMYTETACHDHFVSAYYDMDPWRHSRKEYIHGIVKIVDYLTARGCNVTFYCLGHRANASYTCDDFAHAVGGTNKRFRIELQYSMNQAMLDIRGKNADDTRREFLVILKEMIQNKQLGGAGNSDLMKIPLHSVQYYLMIHIAKFSVLNHAASKMDNNATCKGGGCVVWIDAGGLNIAKQTWKRDARLALRRTDTASFCSTASNPVKWPSHHTTVYLHGPRHEIAAGLMIFDPGFLTRTFFVSFQSLLQSLYESREVTTDQAMLTLMVQKFPEIILLQPSYDKMAERLLLWGNTPCKPPACCSDRRPPRQKIISNTNTLSAERIHSITNDHLGQANAKLIPMKVENQTKYTEMIQPMETNRLSRANPRIWISMAFCLDENTKLHAKGNFKYFLAAKYASLLWIFLTNSNVTVTVITKRDDWKTDIRVQEIERTGAHVHKMSAFDDYSCVTTSQIARMWAFQNSYINDDDIIITADVDAFPSHETILDPVKKYPDKETWVWQMFYVESTGTTIPMSFVGMHKKRWRLLFNKNKIRTVIETFKAYNKETQMKWNLWGLDQLILTYILLYNSICYVQNERIWQFLQLEKKQFDDSTSCWHGQSLYGNQVFSGTNHKWIHLLPSESDNIEKIAKKIISNAVVTPKHL
tara:strand:- start:7743 stop:9914 length:2172 start_codon:yes stop_codon:yes gene_type:complete